MTTFPPLVVMVPLPELVNDEPRVAVKFPPPVVIAAPKMSRPLLVIVKAPPPVLTVPVWLSVKETVPAAKKTPPVTFTGPRMVMAPFCTVAPSPLAAVVTWSMATEAAVKTAGVAGAVVDPTSRLPPSATKAPVVLTDPLKEIKSRFVTVPVV